MEVRDQRDQVVGTCRDAPEGTKLVLGHKPPPEATLDGPMIVKIERHAFTVGMRCQRGEWGRVDCWQVIELKGGEDPSWLPAWRPARQLEEG